MNYNREAEKSNTTDDWLESLGSMAPESTWCEEPECPDDAEYITYNGEKLCEKHAVEHANDNCYTIDEYERIEK
jgi:hypothetical protein